MSQPTTSTATETLGAKVDPTSVRITKAHAVAKDPASRWDSVPRTGKVKVYVWLDDEDGGTFENVSFNEEPDAAAYLDYDAYDAAKQTFWRRENRRWTANRREVLNQVAAALNVDLGKVRFSRTAGCSCSCSPGFVTEKVGQHDLYITATARPAA